MPKLKGKRVLVTGGAGFIGSHLTDRLIQEEPEHIVVVDNLFLGQEENLLTARKNYPSLAFYKEDVTDYEKMKQILQDEKIEVVFDLAVIPLPTSLERPRWTVDANITMTTTICELLREGHYKTLVHYSSSEAYGTAQYVPMDEGHPMVASTPYAASKLAGDYIVLSYCHTFGVDASIIRPFNNFGPRQNDKNYAGIIPIVVHRAMKGEEIVIFGDGEQTRDFIFVRDTANATVGAYESMDTRGRVINLAGEQEVSINHLVRAMLKIMESEVPIRYGPPRLGDVRQHCGAVKLARELIDFAPRFSLEEGLKETIAWYIEKASEEKS